MADFFARLDEACSAKNSLLCVGLDPRLTSHPSNVRRTADDPVAFEAIKQAIVSANRLLIEQTLPYAAAYKPNIAFYEAWGSCGIQALEETIRFIPEDTLIILDVKRNDIGATAEAYAQAAFDRFGADAVTLNPYMGVDAATPFLAREGRGIFMLCRTSNPSAGMLQDILETESGDPLYLRVAREVTTWSSGIGLVVAGNDVEALSRVRREHEDVWFLSPGIGAQGGRAEDAVRAGQRKDGLGILTVVVRGVAAANNPGEAAKAIRDEINRARVGNGGVSGAKLSTVRARRQTVEDVDVRVPTTSTNDMRKMILQGLVRTECFRVGDFVLKSGAHSPFYIDLRRTVSDPVFLKLVAKAYVEISRGLDFDRIAGIPVAALPLATAVSLETGVPMIYPRIPLKQHGTGNRIEGEYRPGERVLLLDDLITTGLSKIEAIEVLRAEGLVVTDLAVLVERSRKGREDMAAAGINLRAYAHVSELFGICREMGVIDEAGEKKMREFVDSGN